jgi:hypothetical protein
MFSTKLRISVIRDESKTRSVLDGISKEGNRPIIFDNVAAIVKIENFETKVTLSQNGDNESVRIGKGRCVELMYTKDSRNP